jgi:uncharacterized membrane protein YcaP (DUF421 family)
MESVAKACAIYILLVALIRLSGRRTVAQMTSFDLILLLIIGSATNRALLGEDFSLVNAVIVVCTLIVLDILMSLAKREFSWFAKIVDGVPMILVDHGHPLRDRLYKARVDEQEVMVAARKHHGLEHMEEVKFAILEADGNISIIPAERERGQNAPQTLRASAHAT